MTRPCPALLAVALFFPVWQLAAGEAVVRPALLAVQEVRREAGLPELERRAILDEVAARRAQAVAGLPHQERLRYSAPVEAALRGAGVARFKQARVHMNMVRGYRYPGETFARQWRTQPSWKTAVDAATDGVGLASATGEDGWIVMVVVLVDDVPPFDGAELESLLLAAVNGVRREHGLGELEPAPELAAVARKHSRDMAARNYLDHRSPDGLESVDRVRAAGIAFRSLAENLHMSRNQQDPVAAAVGGWMQSPGHREAILTEHFSHTGVGVAEDPDGRIYATQLFLSP